jgi:hypothetical protein
MPLVDRRKIGEVGPFAKNDSTCDDPDSNCDNLQAA